MLDGLGSSPAPVEPALAPSIVEVLTSAEPQGGQTQLLLVSRGLGDLQLLLRQPGGTGALSSPVYPLRPLAPLQGCRPFVLEAAMQASPQQAMAQHVQQAGMNRLEHDVPLLQA